MSVNRSTISRSAGVLEIDGTRLYPETEMNVEFAPDFEDVVAWAYGRIDEAKRDLRIPIRTRLWGAYENLGVLFPAGVLSPVPGTSLCDDTEIVLHAKNGDKITFHNGFISRLIDLYLGVDKNVFAADLELMCLIQSGKNPEDADAYFTRSTESFTDTGFAKTNFLRRRATLAWTGKTGFTSFEMREGVNIGWRMDVQYDYSANYGSDNAYLGPGGLIGELRGIPAVSDLANSDTASRGQGSALGTLLSSGAADLTATISGSGSHAIVLKDAALAQHSECFDIRKLRAQEHLWRTTSGFAAGVKSAIATVA